MKRSRFSEEQIIAILKVQEAGMATAEVWHGIYGTWTPGISTQPRLPHWSDGVDGALVGS